MSSEQNESISWPKARSTGVPSNIPRLMPSAVLGEVSSVVPNAISSCLPTKVQEQG